MKGNNFYSLKITGPNKKRIHVPPSALVPDIEIKELMLKFRDRESINRFNEEGWIYYTDYSRILMNEYETGECSKASLRVR